MFMIKIYNTLTRKKEEFKPIEEGKVGLYSCGPTVYNFAHIGNLRAYLFVDVLKRSLLYNGYEVKHVMNVTDVGHLTGDRDMGEDKLEKGAEKEGRSAWEIADFYTKAFMKNLKDLNIIEPDIISKVTDNIPEQIELIKILEQKGYTYKINDGIYFDTSKVKNYNKLSHQSLEDLREGARVEVNPEKKNPTDFALWKFSPKDKKRQMEWESPWGIGFPGWHIECSAISMKFLKDRLDIHCGGIDHIDVHHTNEIAQSESATGKKFFNYWMHNAFLNISGGKKMAKSDNNFLTLENALIKKGIDPLVYRYAFLQVHYRKPMEYSDESMANSAEGLKRLRNQVRELGGKKGEVNKDYKNKFLEYINDDLNMPMALSLIPEVLKSKLENSEKLALILDFDKVFGLKLEKILEPVNVPKEVENLALEREEARKEKNYEKADELRKEIEDMGYIVKDTSDGFEIFKKD
jgi:cysteinyl-tRNA synthetase